jgi:hypothetical protein
MTEFLSAILSFPTVVFTVMLIVIVLYWLMVIIGAIGVDVLNIGEAAGGKIEGMVGGAVEGKIEGVVGGAIEGKIEGMADAAVEAKVEGVASGGGGGFLAILGFGRVPATVVISSLVLWSWALCLVLARTMGQMGASALVVDLVAPVVAVFFAGMLTGLIVRTIGRLVVRHEPQLRRRDLVGKLCTITTGRVDASFGQALIEEGGTDVTIDVRCDPPNALVRRARAVVVAYDEQHNTYTVEAYEQGISERQPRA